jgi:carbamoyl-phosphate synthase small subunit
VFASGLVVREVSMVASSWRARERLEDYLRRHEVVGIADIDTRRLTRLLRERGAQNGCIMAGEHIDENAAVETARAFPGLNGMDLARAVSTEIRYEWAQGSWMLDPSAAPATGRPQPYHVVAYDYGVKRNILCMLVDRGCRVTVVPAQTPVADVLALRPHGVFLSNGPGDPAACDYAIAAIRILLEKRIPLFGICLGHQLLGLASGARTVKMKFGHHGANHPVLDIGSKRVMITSQNHGFAVDEATLPATLRVTHRSLFDDSNQGLHRTDRPAFSFQGHPEASPGPHDAAPLFDHFIELMAQHSQ